QCPPTAILPAGCTSRKRASHDAVAATPEPAAIPLNMRSLTVLKRSKIKVHALQAREVEEPKEGEV
ncbi:hypothetical protein FRB96_003003, partial [Tulasnella sp. 330]